MRNLYYLIMIPLFLASCAGDAADSTTDMEDEKLETTFVDEDALQEEVEKELEGLALNNGAKWKVDSSTSAGMSNIQSLVDNYEGENIKDLGKNIKTELKTIINNCSMKGEDHNQFHILLKAMKKESKLLKKGKSTDPAKMERYLDVYSAHFE